MKATYWDTGNDSVSTVEVDTTDDVRALCWVVTSLRTERGLPTIELAHANGASLSLSFDGDRAFLVWIDPLGETFQSQGGEYSEDLVFDYFGSWSEAPNDSLVAFDIAFGAVTAFMETGSPDTPAVLFAPD